MSIWYDEGKMSIWYAEWQDPGKDIEHALFMAESPEDVRDDIIRKARYWGRDIPEILEITKWPKTQTED